MATYGERFREARKRARLNQEDVQGRLKLKRQGNVSAIETGERVPEPKTIRRHARALECNPSDLLRDVETEYDRIRSGTYDSARQKSPPRLGEAPVSTPRGRQIRNKSA